MEEAIEKHYFEKINLVFAFWVSLMPFFAIVFGVFSFARIDQQLACFAVVYFVFFIINIKKIVKNEYLQNIMKSKFAKYIVICIICWIVLSLIINGAFNVEFLYYISYAFIFLCFLFVDKKYYKKIFNVFVSVLIVSVILSLIFPNSSDVPGFFVNDQGYSMQFVNPNYSAHVVAIVLVVIIGLLSHTESLFEKIFYTIAYILFAWWLYANGSFAPILWLYCFVIIQIIFEWRKTKVCPWKMVCLFVALIPMSFLIDLFPYWTCYRNSFVNFFLECVGVFDNIFGTNILGESLLGADGWDRKELIINTLNHIFESPKNVIFGMGGGAFRELAPHIHLLALWADFGMVVPVLYTILCVNIVIIFFKQHIFIPDSHVFFALFTYFFISFFGSMVCYTYTFVMPVFAFCAKVEYLPVQTDS